HRGGRRRARADVRPRRARAPAPARRARARGAQRGVRHAVPSRRDRAGGDRRGDRPRRVPVHAAARGPLPHGLARARRVLRGRRRRARRRPLGPGRRARHRGTARVLPRRRGRRRVLGRRACRRGRRALGAAARAVGRGAGAARREPRARALARRARRGTDPPRRGGGDRGLGRTTAGGGRDDGARLRDGPALHEVAGQLGLDADDVAGAVEAALGDRLADDVRVGPRPAFTLAPGDEVVLTGSMTRTREAWEADARAAGLSPWPYVTRRTRLLVAAAPDSLSRNARTARRYSIPVVTEAAFAGLLAAGTGGTGRTTDAGARRWAS